MNNEPDLTEEDEAEELYEVEQKAMVASINNELDKVKE